MVSFAKTTPCGYYQVCYDFEFELFQLIPKLLSFEDGVSVAEICLQVRIMQPKTPTVGLFYSLIELSYFHF